MRPEPTNHSLVPTMVEFKFSAIPNWASDNKLALAMYPSVAFWNPYNLPVTLNNVYIEVPLNVWMAAFNPKNGILFLKWYEHNPTAVPETSFFNPYIPFHITSSSSTMPSNLGLPGGFPKFLDLNGNGRRDPGEPRMHIPRIPKEAVRGGGGGGGPFLNYNDIRAFTRHNVIWHGFNLRDMEHPQTRITFGNFRINPGFHWISS